MKTVLSLLFSSLSLVSIAQPGGGKSLDFNGSSQYVTCGSINLSGGQVTIQGWVKVDNFKSGSPGITSITGTEVTGSHCSVRIGDTGIPNNRVQFILLFGSNHIKLNGNSDLVTNRWYHIAATYDGTGMKIYINGVLDASNNQTGSFTSNGLWEIGRNYENGRIIDGELDEISVWTTALSQSTIRDWMCKKITSQHPDYASIKGYWQMNETSGTTTADASGNGYTGTLVSAPTRKNSAAPIGNRSKHLYSTSYSIGISHPQGDSMHFTHTSGTIQGVHLYRVDDTPYDTATPGAIQYFDTSHYWGIFPLGTSSFNVSYYYDGNQVIANESDCSIALAKRDHGASTAWAIQNLSAVNYSGQILQFSTDSRKEFILGISSNGPHSFTYTLSQPSCYADSNSSATVHVSGGLAPYSYNWTSGSTDSTATSLASGFHVFTITDDNDCESTDSVYLGQPTAVTAVPTITNASCLYTANGSISIIPSGGTGAYTYVWNDPSNATTALVSGLFPGVYTVTVTDGNGCDFPLNFTVNSTGPDPIPNLGPADTNVCEGKVFGLTASIQNGPVNQYVWNTGETGAIKIVSTSGTYALTVTNSLGCIGMDSITITYVAPEQPVLPTTATGLGSYVIDAGSGFNFYQWSNGTTGQTNTVAASGTYTVTTTDANGCTATASIAVTITPVGVYSSSSDRTIELYPNPVKDQLNIRLGKPTAFHFTITDAHGRVTMSADSHANTELMIPMDDLTPGVYHIRIHSSEIDYCQRFVRL